MTAESETGRSWSIEGLVEIARWQRSVMWALLAWMLLTAVLFATGQFSEEVTMVIAALRIAAGVLCIFIVYKLANAMGDSGIIYALAMLIPFVGLLVLLSAIIRARSILRKNGVRVGVMGVAQEDIEMLKAQASMKQHDV